MIKVAINGFGRIGRLAFRKIIENQEFEIVAINDLTDPEVLAYLLKYDSAHSTFSRKVEFSNNSIIIDENRIAVYKEKNPENIPWKDHDVDLVLECTGFFASKEKCEAHIKAGAKRVIISAPAGNNTKTIVFNVNHSILNKEDTIISCASCTTNCLAPMVKVLNDKFGIIIGQMSTIHAHTNSQPLLDTPNLKGNLRGSRAAVNNIVPYTTGAAKAIGLVIPELQGKLDGSSQRVPVSTGSVVELYSVLNQQVSTEDVNLVMQQNKNESFGYNTEELVSTDIIGMDYGSLFDASQTKITTVGNVQLVKTVAWYDNEMSFVNQLLRTAVYFGNM